VSPTHFIEEQVQRDESMDDCWCEGIALIDHNNRVPLFDVDVRAGLRAARLLLPRTAADVAGLAGAVGWRIVRCARVCR
jgi:hypothetical protein